MIVLKIMVMIMIIITITTSTWLPIRAQEPGLDAALMMNNDNK